MLNILGIIVIIYLIIHVFKGEIGKVFNQLFQTNPLILALVLILGILYLMCEGYMIKQLAASFSNQFTTKMGICCASSVAFFRVVTFGSGTTISEVLFYRSKGMDTSDGIGMTILHMIFYKTALLLTSICALFYTYSWLTHTFHHVLLFLILGMILTLLMIVLLLFITLKENWHRRLVTFLDRKIKRASWRQKLKKFNEQVISLRASVQKMIAEPAHVFFVFVLNIGKLFFWYSIPYIVLHQESNISYLFSISLVALTLILSGVIPTPAGIGSFEFVYMLLFRPVVGTVLAISSLLLYRFASYIFPFICGMIYEGMKKRKQLKREIKSIRRNQNV